MSINTHWLWNPSEVANSPSAQAGISSQQENRLRLGGVRIIKDLGTAMNLKINPTLATASVFFHRFYMFHSFYDYPSHMMALACLYLAGKVEETPKKSRDLVKSVRVKWPNHFNRCKNLTNELILLERVLLQTLRFDLYVEHPYNFLIEYAKCFKLDKEFMNKIVNSAWKFINDSLASTICLMWEPEVIATALLYMSLKMERISMENSLASKPEEEQTKVATNAEEQAQTKLAKDVVEQQQTKLDPGVEERKQQTKLVIGIREMEDKEWWNVHIDNLTVPMIDTICHQVLDCISMDEDMSQEN